MSKKAILMILLLLGVASVPSSAADNKPTTKTLTGVISDSMCGAKHMAKDKSAADCTRECVKSGSDYALVVGEKVYTLKGNAADLDKYAGEQVTVKGTVSGNTITAESVTAAKGSK
ncbi:MAG: hypothetical protein DMG65_09680 [Candidatus Angelobacter sp. Gp1-AA117]|nr:MAG: hypothetical protein DMG65_09680 [Candidatus Angelobacter sp. Gp1-AA117]